VRPRGVAVAHGRQTLCQTLNNSKGFAHVSDNPGDCEPEAERARIASGSGLNLQANPVTKRWTIEGWWTLDCLSCGRTALVFESVHLGTRSHGRGLTDAELD